MIGLSISIIEINNFIVAASHYNTLIIWDEKTYECIETIKCAQWNSRGLWKLNDNTLVVGGFKVIKFIDIKTYQTSIFKDESIGVVRCLYVDRNELIFIGNEDGEILCYDTSFNQIVFKSKFHNKRINCIIETEDNHLISSFYDTINIHNWFYKQISC